MFWKSFTHTFLVGAIIASSVAFGLFDPVITKDGFENYAERPWQFVEGYIPHVSQYPMPANTFVNLGYLIIAVYWLLWTKKAHKEKHITDHQAYMFYIFAWSSLLYAPIQLIRITTQNHHFAILDQWYTLPIFAWVTVWGSFLLNGWDPPTFLSIMAASCCSYCLALVHVPGHEDIGFEFALAVHIIFAVLYGIKVCQRFYSSNAVRAFWWSIICCTGFVTLKLLDQTLPTLHPFFRLLSGHFWSKIADFLQIHFVFVFFKHITSNVSESRKKGS